MIWQLEGERYHVELPRLFMAYRPTFRAQTQKLLLLDRKSNDQKYLTAANWDRTGYKAATQALRHNPDDTHRTYWVLSHDKFCICPMLVPLDRANKPIPHVLQSEFEDGYLVSGGYLTCGKPKKSSTLSKISDQCGLVDEGPGEPLEWFYCNGCLISKSPLFLDTAENAWEQLCEELYDERTRL